MQADLDHYDRMAAEIGRFETVRRIIDTHVDLSGQALAHRDLALLIWPETVYPTTFGNPKSDAERRSIARSSTSRRAPTSR